MIPVILSGGSGKRLWPLSVTHRPKQFCSIFGGSLLSETLRRFDRVSESLIVTTQELLDLTLQDIDGLGIAREQILLEPVGRNTAPAVALMCFYMQKLGREGEVVGVFPSDAHIEDVLVFREALKKAEAKASSADVVTLGIQPRRPATGYGYIEVLGENITLSELCEVKSFHEKPDLATAQQYIASGQYFWNAGMFVFKVSRMIELFKEHLPELWDGISQIKDDFSNLSDVYPSLISISMDNGIIEKCKNLFCIPVEMGWSDVGSWDELSHLQSQGAELAADQTHIFGEAKNNFVFSKEKRDVALIGVEDLIVVNTAQATFVCKKGFGEQIKNVLSEHPHLQDARTEQRPWGQYTILQDESSYKTKKISVKPGHRLSYQSHEKRAETWTIIKGKAEVTLNGQVIVLNVGESINIKVGDKHRIKNTGAEYLEFIEVQTGTYFGEDDIIRYEDDFGRV